MTIEDVIIVLEYEVTHSGLPRDVYPQLRDLVARAHSWGFSFYSNNVSAVYAPVNPFGSKRNGYSLKFPGREIGKVKQYGRSGRAVSDQSKILEQLLSNSGVPTDYLKGSRRLMATSFIRGFNLAKSWWEPFYGESSEGVRGIYWRSKYDAQDLKNRLCAYAGINT